MKIIGLTGGIGMGKSTVSKIFKGRGIPVFDADWTVKHIQDTNPSVLKKIRSIIPESITEISSFPFLKMDRKVIRDAMLVHPDIKVKLENILHPMVWSECQKFIQSCRRKNVSYVILDVPLLFERQYESICDFVITLSAPVNIQKQRVLRRGTLNEAQFCNILNLQLTDLERRKKADFVIETGLSRFHTMKKIKHVINTLYV